MLKLKIKKMVLVVGLLILCSAIAEPVMAEDKGKCPIDEDSGVAQCPSGSSIRLQIGLPLVSDTCTYYVDQYDFDEPSPQKRLKQNVPKTMHCVKAFPQYIKGVYNLFVSIVGILAVIMIMLGGFQWLLAAGNAQKISGAKTTIISAVMGLVLTLGIYSILNWVNPSLVKLKLKVHDVGLDGSDATLFCKAGKKLFPPLKSGKVAECGKQYLLYGQDGEQDTRCAGAFCSSRKVCLNSAVKGQKISAVCGNVIPGIGIVETLPEKDCGSIHYRIKKLQGSYSSSYVMDKYVGTKYNNGYCVLDISSPIEVLFPKSEKENYKSGEPIVDTHKFIPYSYEGGK